MEEDIQSRVQTNRHPLTYQERQRLIKRCFSNVDPYQDATQKKVAQLLQNDSRHCVPHDLHKNLPDVVSALMRPSAEAFVNRKANMGRRLPSVFGAQHLLHIANDCLTANKDQAVEVNMGVTFMKNNPTMLAYFLLALNRYNEILELGDRIGNNRMQIKLRFFSTIGFNVDYPNDNDDSEADIEKINKDSQAQEDLLRAFIQRFYPKVASTMPEFRISEYPRIDSREHRKLRKELAKYLKSNLEVADSISALGERHGGYLGDSFAKDYFAFHSSAGTFRDASMQPPPSRLSIGGPSEVLFNMTRQGILEQASNAIQGRTSPRRKRIAALTAPPRVICKTPPYLDRDRLFSGEAEISMTEFLEGDTDRMKQLLADPLSYKVSSGANMQHPVAREYLLLGASLVHQGFAQDCADGVRVFRGFLIDHYKD